jgi:hypothetical protein
MGGGTQGRREGTNIPVCELDGRFRIFWTEKRTGTRLANMKLKNAVFWDVAPRGSFNNRCFGGTSLPHNQSAKKQQDRNNVSSN